MSLAVRPMHADEADAVAGMVRGLAEHIGSDFVPALTGEKLRKASDLIDVVVAEDGGRLIGACLGLMTFSTWRGAPGLYVVDLFVLPEARGRNAGLDLLRCSARRFAARGARFVKLEVDESNSGAGRFYARLGFNKKAEDRLHILEQDKFMEFVGGQS
ncbi:GNAT family N-acetyltransferase [Aestuariivirga sp.]|uniref:GNAT family N-acetyltransferase n=1 Tax=Aestuariivirga sp. TaxID=2650926 RepID=UPI0025C33455|nr:GNAT family N-acetyltransferase [Aestuariivirga sp.]MCA3556273.1 GNAT family N-acetyltransferase [Aestuariivirga sp.]